VIDYPVRLGVARGGILLQRRKLGDVLNRCKLDDETNEALQEIHLELGELLSLIKTES
jgi:hypothetical protein